MIELVEPLCLIFMLQLFLFACVWVLLFERTNRSLKKEKQLFRDHIFGSFVYDVEIENQKTSADSCVEHCKEQKKGRNSLMWRFSFPPLSRILRSNGEGLE